jgi:hypothetical protein
MGIKLVERWVGFKHAFLCVKNDAFDNAIRFRSVYSRILLHVFVDCYPQKNFVRLSYAWVGSRFFFQVESFVAVG